MAPGLGLLLGAAVLPFLPRLLGRAWVVALGLATLLFVASLEPGETATVTFWREPLHVLAVDPIRLLFGWAFSLALLLWGVFAWEEDDRWQKAAGLAYVGCGLLVVFAGDWTVFALGWEGMALASAGIVLCGRTPAARAAGLRILGMHIFGGVLVLAGVAALHAHGPAPVLAPLALRGLGPILLLLGLLVHAAAWPLAAWLPDAYPRARPEGSVLLAAITVNAAAFALLRLFPGAGVLSVLGALMVIYALLYALFTREPRRLLSYALVGQVGVLLAAAGALPAAHGGAPTLGQAAATAHALSIVLALGLLFMTAAAAPRDGRRGWTFGFAVVGAATVCALPPTAGFATTRLVLDAVALRADRAGSFARTVLVGATVAWPLAVGLRFPWLVFARSSGEAQEEAVPIPMRIAMGAAAFLCLALGFAPGVWLRHLPGLEGASPALAWGPVGLQLGLLLLGVLAFLAWRFLGARALFSPPGGLPDLDRLWRGAGLRALAFVTGPFERTMARFSHFVHERVPEQFAWMAQNPPGFIRVAIERLRLGVTALFGSARMIDNAQARFASQLDTYRRTRAAAAWPIGRTVFYVSLILALALVVWLVR
jgi:multicomponent Na+:H+ antiporter subunit D